MRRVRFRIWPAISFEFKMVWPKDYEENHKKPVRIDTLSVEIRTGNLLITSQLLCDISLDDIILQQ